MSIKPKNAGHAVCVIALLGGVMGGLFFAGASSVLSEHGDGLIHSRLIPIGTFIGFLFGALAGALWTSFDRSGRD